MPIPSEGSHVMDVASATTTYEGWAKRKGASTGTSVWKMRKITYNASGDMTSITWADGDELYNNEWDNRATTVAYS